MHLNKSVHYYVQFNMKTIFCDSINYVFDICILKSSDICSTIHPRLMVYNSAKDWCRCDEKL